MEAALAEESVVFLRGPRQAGKTTLVRSLGSDRRYLSLDDLFGPELHALPVAALGGLGD